VVKPRDHVWYLSAAQHEDDQQVEHFRRVLLPRILEFLTDKLLDALKSKLPGRRERAATALVALGTPAVMPIAMRLVRGKNLAYHLRLVELLGELGRTERAPLLPLLRALHTPGLRTAALAALGEDGCGHGGWTVVVKNN
jgi:HEAT repeat protein